ncbi:MAG TPA: hypothetical protein DEO86_14820 [Colwellia sp.]|nr:hypothetical protein [Colwellia sp.]|tara:strand:- start:1738 stop:2880 length:1143 start_codon:yes stop_codon:yes gene_type:complete
MNNKMLSSILFVLTLSNCAKAEVVWNGFSSIVAGTTGASDTKKEGFENEVNFEQDSLFAMQASSDLGNGLSVTAQVMARGENSWDPKFEWAYVAYDLNDDIRILAGRQRIPFFMYSDYLDVSYAYDWITPPDNVYGIPFSSFNGLGAIYNHSFSGIDGTLHLIYGSTPDDINVGGGSVKSNLENMVGGAYTLTRDWLTLRAAYIQLESTIELNAYEPLITAWKQTPYSYVSDNLTIDSDLTRFYELGIQATYEDYSLIAEYTQSKNEGAPTPNEENYYVMASKRFNQFSAHITYGKTKRTQDSLTDGVPNGISPQLDNLIQFTGLATEFGIGEKSYMTYGLRWDIHDSAALKFEYTDQTSNLALDGGDATLFRTALVTVF